jgi:Rieske Fe-S protein
MLLPACDDSPTAPTTIPAGTTTPPAGTTTLASVASTVVNRTVSISIDANSPLANVGTAATTQTSIGGFLIARVGTGNFNVMTSTCTHEACTINGFNNSRFVCPCHGSQFSTSGGLLVGPATSSLQTFSSSFDSGTGVLTFTA